MSSSSTLGTFHNCKEKNL